MVMPPCGTFDYVAIIPSARVEGVLSVGATLRVPVERRGRTLTDNRLVGWTPQVEISAKDVVLEAAGRELSQVSKATFEVDSGFASLLEPDDRVHLVRTATADVAVSVLRDERLVLAVGAVTKVPLGLDVAAASSFEEVEVSVGDQVQSLRLGNSALLGPYAVSMLGCCEPGDPGHFECVSIEARSRDTADVAYRCAVSLAGRRVLYRDPIDLVSWPRDLN